MFLRVLITTALFMGSAKALVAPTLENPEQAQEEIRRFWPSFLESSFSAEEIARYKEANFERRQEWARMCQDIERALDFKGGAEGLPKVKFLFADRRQTCESVCQETEREWEEFLEGRHRRFLDSLSNTSREFENLTKKMESKIDFKIIASHVSLKNAYQRLSKTLPEQILKGERILGDKHAKLQADLKKVWKAWHKDLEVLKKNISEKESRSEPLRNVEKAWDEAFESSFEKWQKGFQKALENWESNFQKTLDRWNTAVKYLSNLAANGDSKDAKWKELDKRAGGVLNEWNRELIRIFKKDWQKGSSLILEDSARISEATVKNLREARIRDQQEQKRLNLELGWLKATFEGREKNLASGSHRYDLSDLFSHNSMRKEDRSRCRWANSLRGLYDEDRQNLKNLIAKQREDLSNYNLGVKRQFLGLTSKILGQERKEKIPLWVWNCAEIERKHVCPEIKSQEIAKAELNRLWPFPLLMPLSSTQYIQYGKKPAHFREEFAYLSMIIKKVGNEEKPVLSKAYEDYLQEVAALKEKGRVKLGQNNVLKEEDPQIRNAIQNFQSAKQACARRKKLESDLTEKFINLTRQMGCDFIPGTLGLDFQPWEEINTEEGLVLRLRGPRNEALAP